MGFRAFLLASIILEGAFACLQLEGIHLQQPNEDATTFAKEDYFTKDSLRNGGDIWDPSHPGCSRLPCGMFLNTEPSETRVQVSSIDDLGMKIKTKITKLWGGGHVDFQLKYGKSPDFGKTPGFELGNVNIAAGSDIETVYKDFYPPQPAYSYEATIQVAYHTTGLSKAFDTPNGKSNPSPLLSDSDSYFQCIDVEIMDGLPFPEGDYPHGLGPTEVDGDFGQKGTTFLEPDGLGPFWIAFIILMILLCICVILVIILWKSQSGSEDEGPAVQPIIHEEPQAAVEPPKKEKTPTPAKEPSAPSAEEEEATGQITYQDQEQEKAEPPPEKIGSEGRHFHFRYVEEDEGKGDAAAQEV